MPTSTPSRPRRWASYAATTALLAGAATVLSTGTARAADTGDETLTWRISQYLDEHLTSQAFTNGATEDTATGKVTFSGGTGQRSAAGTTTLTYQGTARYAFNNPGTGAEIYSITISDPAVVLDAAGEGTILADVAWSVPSQGVTGSVSDKLLTTIAPADATWTRNVLSGTPRWAGVAAADAYGPGKPVGGQSWDPGFVTAMPSSLNPFFYASGSANDAKKSPGSLVAVAQTPTVTVATTSSTPAELVLRVQGNRFNPTSKPGDAGVYVGLAPAGGLPDVSSQAGMDAFAASAWVMPAQFSAGAFTTSLTAAAAKLDRTKTWSVYTWQAHGHSNTTQDTETPVSIDWASLTPGTTPGTAPVTAPPASTTPSVTLRWTRKASATTAGKLRITLGTAAQHPTGSVAVVLKKQGREQGRKQDRKVTRTATLSGGTATVKTPRLARGTWKVVVTYAGQGGYTSIKKTAKITVR